MKESNNKPDPIKDLKIKQQAYKIVSRNDIELAAVIQATKDNMKNPEKSIEDRKREIVKSKLQEQAKKDKQELKEAKLVANMEKKLSKWSDIDEVLSLLDDEEEKRAKKRSEEVQKIMDELNAKKTSRSSIPSKTPVSSRQASLEKKELESRRIASRKDQKQKDALAPEFNAVMEKAMQKRLDEKIERATEEIRKKSIQTSSIAKPVAQAPVRTAVKTTTKSEEKSEKNSFMKSFINLFSKSTNSKSTKSKEQDSGKVVVKNAPVKESAANTEKTISSYKVIPGVKVYQESIDAYHTGKIKHLIDIAIGVAHNGIKNARQNFVDSLQYATNPEAARKKLENKNANTPTFRPGMAR